MRKIFFALFASFFGHFFLLIFISKITQMNIVPSFTTSTLNTIIAIILTPLIVFYAGAHFGAGLFFISPGREFDSSPSHSARGALLGALFGIIISGIIFAFVLFLNPYALDFNVIANDKSLVSIFKRQNIVIIILTLSILTSFITSRFFSSNLYKKNDGLVHRVLNSLLTPIIITAILFGFYKSSEFPKVGANIIEKENWANKNFPEDFKKIEKEIKNNKEITEILGDVIRIAPESPDTLGKTPFYILLQKENFQKISIEIEGTKNKAIYQIQSNPKDQDQKYKFLIIEDKILEL